MLLTLSAATSPEMPDASDLGYLLHKHPDRVQTFATSSGPAYVMYPEAGVARCTAALLLDVDPVALVRGRRGVAAGFTLGQYVNDRPYAASSLLAVALGKVFRTAMAGRCDARPDLPEVMLPLELSVPCLPCRDGAALVRRLFEPLGWEVEVSALPLDPEHPEWGDAAFVGLVLRGRMRVADALSHLYVLLPVLDDSKHYWVSPDEVDKLIRAGGEWLAGHPDRELISRRYLSHRGQLWHDAIERLAELDDSEPVEDAALVEDGDPVEESATPERPEPLVRLRHEAVLAAVRGSGASSVIDLGCGPGALLVELTADRSLTRITGTDVSHRALEIAARRLRLDRLPERQRDRLELFQSSLTYRDTRFRGYDAAVLMEVIEHLDLPRLGALEHVVFGDARPGTVIVTTPNAEHNVRYDGLPAGQLRHQDHRFEWSRAQFAQWAGGVADRRGYGVRLVGVGPDDPEVGASTQMAVFSRLDAGAP